MASLTSSSKTPVHFLFGLIHVQYCGSAKCVKFSCLRKSPKDQCATRALSPPVRRLNLFCIATYGARLYLSRNPPFPASRRSPSGWANVATRLRRWAIGFLALCRLDDLSLYRMQKRWMAHAYLQRSRSLTRANCGGSSNR
jgi:hypothetical protein